MTEVRTDAIRVFQKRVHEMSSANQKEIRLTAQEARNLSNELAQLTALIVQAQSQNNNNTVEVIATGSKF
jgi:glutaredoxin 2